MSLENLYPKLKNATYTTTRPFMAPDGAEPNTYYRPWLEQHIGQQGVHWDWRILSPTGDKLGIDFANKDDAILFELTWQ